MKDQVTNRDLYTEILRIHEKIDSVVDKRITPLERTVDKMWIYMSFGIGLVSLAFTGIWDFIKEKLFKS